MEAICARIGQGIEWTVYDRQSNVDSPELVEIAVYGHAAIDYVCRALQKWIFAAKSR